VPAARGCVLSGFASCHLRGKMLVGSSFALLVGAAALGRWPTLGADLAAGGLFLLAATTGHEWWSVHTGLAATSRHYATSEGWAARNASAYLPACMYYSALAAIIVRYVPLVLSRRVGEAACGQGQHMTNTERYPSRGPVVATALQRFTALSYCAVALRGAGDVTRLCLSARGPASLFWPSANVAVPTVIEGLLCALMLGCALAVLRGWRVLRWLCVGSVVARGAGTLYLTFMRCRTLLALGAAFRRGLVLFGMVVPFEATATVSLLAGLAWLAQSAEAPIEEPLCSACGYRLRGLTSSRCPECGQPFESGNRSTAAAR
jgi:hypothetical protein